MTWFPAAERFGGPGAWDARGRSILGPRVDDLVRRAATVRGDRVLVGQPVPTARGRPTTGLLPSSTSAEMVEPELGAVTSIDAVIAQGSGAALISEPLVLATFGGVGVGRICAQADATSSAQEPCPDTAPLAVETLVTPDEPGILSTYFGPLFVAVEDGVISRVTLTGGGTGSQAWTPDRTGTGAPPVPPD